MTGVEDDKKLSPEGEALIRKMLSCKPNLPEPEIRTRILSKLREGSPLLNDEGACFLVASELGISLIDDDDDPAAQEPAGLTTGMTDVNVTGPVLYVSPLHRFTKRDGTVGQLRKLILGYERRTPEVVLWDEKASLVDEQDITRGSIITINRGYSRQSFAGDVEIHVGQRGIVEKHVSTPQTTQVPLVESFFSKPSDVTEENTLICLQGVIGDLYPLRTFERPTGQGKVLRLKLQDSTGETTVVVWNERADELSHAAIGDTLFVLRGKVKRGKTGQLEVHVNKNSYIESRVSPSISSARGKTSQDASFTPQRKKISELLPNDRYVTVEGVLKGSPTSRIVTLNDGTSAKVVNAQLADESGEIRLSAWREHADALEKLASGAKIRLTGASTKMGVMGKLDLVTRMSTKLETLT